MAIPTEVLSYEVDRAITDKDGEVTGTEKVQISPQYFWKITREKANFYIPQRVNPWDYEEDTEGMSEANLEPVATLSKVATDGGAVRYAGSPPTAICNIPRYLFAAWQRARVMYPLKLADAVELERL